MKNIYEGVRKGIGLAILLSWVDMLDLIIQTRCKNTTMKKYAIFHIEHYNKKNKGIYYKIAFISKVLEFYLLYF